MKKTSNPKTAWCFVLAVEDLENTTYSMVEIDNLLQSLSWTLTFCSIQKGKDLVVWCICVTFDLPIAQLELFLRDKAVIKSCVIRL